MDRHDKGQKVLEEVFGAPLTASGPAFEEMTEITSDYLFGEIWSASTSPRSLFEVLENQSIV